MMGATLNLIPPPRSPFDLILYIHVFIINVCMLCCCYCYRYLANDMQFFLTSPIIIFALWKHRNVGLGLLVTLLVTQTPHYNVHHYNHRFLLPSSPLFLVLSTTGGFPTRCILIFILIFNFWVLDLGWWKSQYGGLP